MPVAHLYCFLPIFRPLNDLKSAMLLIKRAIPRIRVKYIANCLIQLLSEPVGAFVVSGGLTSLSL